MKKLSLAMLAMLGAMTSAQAHQIWIEQADGAAVVRFGEFGENLREASPGLLDKFAKVTATLVSAKGEQNADATKSADGFKLPFAAATGDSIVAEDANYPLYTWKQQDKEVRSWFYPGARLITGFNAQQPKLPLDLVPTGQPGQFKLVFKDQPKPKTKVTLTTQSGWAKEARTDAQGLVSFDMPWKGIYVAEVSVTDKAAGERAGEKYDAISYATAVTYEKPDGLPPLPPGPPATPAAPRK
ncbi:cobalt ABC transporter substrate-binding protein [Rhodopseudomonas palustris]|uniref:Cobalt ABC transporter substrate-binding protein n=1 Tax=Rhodopseudomonas palustris TaxID=1076 RepID=A0A323UL42_RHOPL|nr:cobalt ABC transporter substrate-binding protein [Rhodopseudomonas palustris]PZA13234.1 cobalt ABC transporter substrate-binding protein [Rhodopseudomonas palustris]